MQHVYLLTLPQSFASGVLGAKDLLNADDALLNAVDGRAHEKGLSFHTEVVGTRRTVETTYGPPLTMDRLLTDAHPADIVYISPLAVPPEHEPDYEAAMLEWLRDQYAAGALICSACTGTLALAASGLLDGVPATTHWAYTETFCRHYPVVDLRANRTLVVGGADKRLITAGAHASWYDLMLYLIHRFSGAAAARRIARIFLLDWHELDQNAYATFRDNRQHGDNVIGQAQQWLTGHLSHPEPVEAAIACSGLPQRSFHRRFRQATGLTPIRYVQRLRIEKTKDMLENTDMTIEEIAWRVGYKDAAYFRRLFRRDTGLTPAKYRKAFRTPADVVRMLP